MKKTLALIIIVIAINIRVSGQSAGISIGGGFIGSNSPNVSSYSSSIFLESPILYNTFSLRLSFLYDADFNQLLPNSTNIYNPFIKGISLKGLTTQNISGNYYLDEGIGVLLVNDRIFNTSNFIDYGFVISLGAGFDLRHDKSTGLRIGAGTDFGFTITNTYAKYFSVHFMLQYYF
jgi:hypothetical protein